MIIVVKIVYERTKYHAIIMAPSILCLWQLEVKASGVDNKPIVSILRQFIVREDAGNDIPVGFEFLDLSIQEACLAWSGNFTRPLTANGGWEWKRRSFD